MLSPREAGRRVVTVYRLLSDATDFEARHRDAINREALVLSNGRRWISGHEARWIAYHDGLHGLYSDLLGNNLAMPGGIIQDLDARVEPRLESLFLARLGVLQGESNYSTYVHIW